MHFSVCFSKERVHFDPKIHFKEEDFIFSIEILEEEGLAAQAWLTFQNPYGQDHAYPWFFSLEEDMFVYISACPEEDYKNIQLLFIGKLFKTPQVIDEEFITLRITALPGNSEEQEKNLVQFLKEQDAYEALFETNTSEDNLRSMIEKTPFVLYWDRLGHQVSLIDYKMGRYQKNLTSEMFKKDLRFILKSIPLQKVIVKIDVEWLQRANGVIDIYDQVAKHFESGKINTLTGPDFLKKWWKIGDGLGYAGYRIVRSSIRPISGLGAVLPRSCRVPIREKQDIHLKQCWFEGELFLKWDYRQRRHESLRFFMDLDFCKEDGKEGNEEILFINLGNITLDLRSLPWKEGTSYKIGNTVIHRDYVYVCTVPHVSQKSFYMDEFYWSQKGIGRGALEDFSVSSFFLTDRGKRVFERALYWAKNYMLKKARCIEITFKGRVEDLGGMTTADYLEIEDPSLPGGKVKGKVIKYHLKADARDLTQWVHITLSLVPGNNAKNREIERLKEDSILSPEGIAYTSFENQNPLYGILHPKELQAFDIVRYVDIHHTSTSQKRYLSQQTFSSVEEVEEYLSQYRTNVTIHLQDMRQTIPIFHCIRVPWVEPVKF